MNILKEIDLVELFISINEVIKEYYTKEVKVYFQDFKRKYLKGYFQELQAILMHI